MCEIKIFELQKKGCANKDRHHDQQINKGHDESSSVSARCVAPTQIGCDKQKSNGENIYI